MKNITVLTYRERLLRVLVHIQENLDNELNLDELSRLAHFSPYHSHRLFRAMVGEAVHQYIRRLRLERAAFMLRQTETPVVQLALDAGYETHEAFTRAFKSMFGKAPSAYRDDTATSIRKRAALSLSAGTSTPQTVIRVEVQQLESYRIAFVRHVDPTTRSRKPSIDYLNGRLQRGFWADRSRFLASATITRRSRRMTKSDSMRHFP